MQSLARTRPSRLSFVLLSSLLLGACASTGKPSGVQKAEATVGTVERLSDQLGQLATQLDATSAALGGLRESVGAKGLFNRAVEAKSDIPAAFGQYRKALEAVRTTAKKVASTDADLSGDMNAYLETWEQNMAEVQNVKLREASMKRRTSAQERYQKVTEEFGGLWKAFEGHLTQLNEIEVALGSDLTPAGVAAIDDTLGDTQKQSDSVKKGLGKASEILSGFADALRASAPQPAAAP